MNGILCIDKPKDFTSFDVIAKMRGIAHTRKIGHTGTLDPMATGVLILLFGNATKAASLITDKTKSYIASFTLGIVTDTQDITGTITKRTENFNIAKEEIESVLKNFCGEIKQIPPMYSAVSVDGKRLYSLARQGKEVERTPRTVNIIKLSLDEFDGVHGKISVTCSEGTYIRTLIHDMGQMLKVGAVLTELNRTQASTFTLSDCITLEKAGELANSGALKDKLIPTDKLFSQYPAIYLSEKQASMFKNGIRLDKNRIKNNGEGIYRVYGNEFLALAKIVKDELIITKSFYSNTEG